MAEEHNVFRRWVRLKQAATPRRDTTPASTASEDAATPPLANAAEDRPFDLSSLPSIESIAANTDIAAFLRTGVPAELTRAALRRAWASDPAIRDFIGIAENQWDFNDPSAIPGFGPLDPMETSTELLDQVGLKLQQLPDALSDLVHPAEKFDPAVAVAPESDLDQRPVIGELVGNSVKPGGMQDTTTQREKEPIDEARNLSRKRRHGSALPR